MWLVVTRRMRPDKPYWHGRRAFAALDAVGWPLAWIAAALQLPRHGGVIGVGVVMWATVAAGCRLHLAIWRNQRYVFTTWRWSRAAAVLLVVAAVATATMALA